MVRPIPVFARGVRYDEADDERTEPDGRGDEERDGATVAEGFDDGGEEEEEGLDEVAAVLEEEEDVDAFVHEHEFEAGPGGDAAGRVGGVSVAEEAQLGVGALGGGEPVRGGGVVGEDEYRAGGDEDGDAAFDYEEPLPR